MIGLVLEGGGAKGAYHIGAYRALSELGIQIDGVVGTSIGAINAAAAEKAARFMQLCDAHGLPLITLCDTPGMMVGPDVEETALGAILDRIRRKNRGKSGSS